MTRIISGAGIALWVFIWLGVSNSADGHAQGQKLLDGIGRCLYRDIRPQGVEDCINTGEVEITLIGEDEAPPHVSCSLAGGTCVLCSNGKWISHECSQGMAKSRHRRGAILAALGSLAMEAASGIIGQLIPNLFGGGSSEPQPPPPINMPPFLEGCPESQTVYCKEGENSAIVYWQPPIARDYEDVVAHARLGGTNRGPGKPFLKGVHNLYYEVRDMAGLTDYCYFTIEVKVITCSRPGWLENGKVSCGKTELTYGFGCIATCDPGYELHGDKYLICSSNGKLDKPLPECKPNTCPPLVLPKGGKRFSCSRGNKYKSVCFLECSAGYDNSAFTRTSCTKDGQWSSKQIYCVDVAAPEYINCPSVSMLRYADRGKNSTVVTWPAVIARDNGQNLTAKQTVGPPSGSVFEEGSHLIRYESMDKSGNTAFTCDFYIQIEVHSCGAPPFTDKDLQYTCTKGVIYGSECDISCQFGYQLQGVKKITCEEEGKGFVWKTSGVQSAQCIKKTCSELSLPANGMLSCDNFMNVGKMCNLHCLDGYALPRTIDTHSMFMCSKATGQWYPKTLPDCTERIFPKKIFEKVRAQYSGDCSTPKSLEGVKQSFHTLLSAMNWEEWCQGKKCTFENLTVSCEEIEIPVNKSGNSTDLPQKRKTTKRVLRVTWDFVIPLDQASTNTNHLLRSLMTILTIPVSVARSLVRNDRQIVESAGNIFMLEHFKTIGRNIICDEGQLPRPRKWTCAGCTKGTYFSKSTQTCEPCPLGLYQDEEAKLYCKRCPPGSRTDMTGTKSIDGCKKICLAGSFSIAGVQPCVPCPKGQYQPLRGARECLKCPHSKTTNMYGSTTQKACSSYDVRLEAPATLIFDGKLRRMKTLGFMFWFKYTNTFEAEIKTSDDSFEQLKITLTQSAIKLWTRSGGLSAQLSHQPRSWTHLAISYTTSGNKNLVVYQNGRKVFSEKVSRSGRFLANGDSKLSVKLTTGDLTLGSFDTFRQPLSVEDILGGAQSCSSRPPKSFLNLDRIDNDNSQNVSFEVPSICRSLQCEASRNGYDCQLPLNVCSGVSCQNGGKCTVETNGFKCNCPVGFDGPLCENAVGDGGWNLWSVWGPCSAECGEGVMTRTRQCNNPPPKPWGKPCTGKNMKQKACTVKNCKVCQKEDLQLGEGVILRRCIGGKSSMSCQLDCHKGLFTLQPANATVYHCERGRWKPNRQTFECLAPRVPNDVQIKLTGQYDIPTCPATSAIENMTTKLQNDLKPLSKILGKAGSLHGRVIECSTGSDNKVNGEVLINLPYAELVQTAEKGSFNMSTMSKVTKAMLTALKYDDYSALKLKMDLSTVHSLVPKTVKVTSELHCPDGSAPNSKNFCVNCGKGTFAINGKCETCKIGTYQEKTGQVHCEPCPGGQTTLLRGSISRRHCVDESP